MRPSYISLLLHMGNILSCCSRLVKGAPVVTAKSNAPDDVPDFVIKYAPLLYLHSQDKYLPSDIGAQITNTTPRQEFAGLTGAPSPLTLENLDQLNTQGKNGTNIFLTSNDDITKNPTWIMGVAPNAEGKTEGATTCAVIVADKGNGTTDAFYMYFYAYNWGGTVNIINMNLGNHVGDWEHTMVRFKDGVPQAVWLSAHSGGQAYKYSVLHKDKAGIRPVVYSSNGSHANYAITGTHNHDNPEFNLPIEGFVNDHTDTGPLWDPIQSAYWYSWKAPVAAVKKIASPPTPTPAATASPTSFDGTSVSSPASNESSISTAATNPTSVSTTSVNAVLPLERTTRVTSLWGTFTPYDASTPIGYLYYVGRWGDFRYPISDPRQQQLFGAAWKYDSGPTGPGDKKLDRKDIWPPGSKNDELLTKLVP